MQNAWLYPVFTALFMLFMFTRRMYNVTTFYYVDRIVNSVVTSTVLSALCVSMVVFLSQSKATSRYLFAFFIAFGGGFVLLGRVLMRKLRQKQVLNGYQHVAFWGGEEVYRQFTYYVSKTAMRLKISYLGDYDAVDFELSRFEKSVVDMSADQVYFAYCPERDDLAVLKQRMAICQELGVTANLVLDALKMPQTQRFISSVGLLPVLTYHAVSLNRGHLFFKSVMDVVMSLVALAVLWPVMLAVAIAIRLDSPGPAIFRQPRVGRNGRVFRMYKFRSMYTDAEARKKELEAHNKIKDGMMFKVDNDPRITKVGRFIRKTSLDELPQLLNVLRGEMSLVGTRPPTLDEVEKYTRNHRFRLCIKPGITGIWQVSGRSDIVDFEEVVRLDQRYIMEWSPLLDIKLMLKTFSAVLGRRGAA